MEREVIQKRRPFLSVGPGDSAIVMRLKVALIISPLVLLFSAPEILELVDWLGLIP
jgi:hypothetical protein